MSEKSYDEAAQDAVESSGEGAGEDTQGDAGSETEPADK